MRFVMKKIIAILLVAFTVVAMTACGPKGGGNSGGGSSDANKEFYGTWTCVKLQSIDGSIDDEVFELTRQSMLAENKLFYFEFGDKSYMYNPDDNGGYTKLEIVLDVENSLMYAAGNRSDEIKFKLIDGQMVIDETSNGVRFYMAKE